jgi:hypothetical protein
LRSSPTAPAGTLYTDRKGEIGLALRYTEDKLPVWDSRAQAFTDPDTGIPLPSWEQACEELTEPTHVVRFGAQVHVKGILGGTEEAGRHIGYL